MSRESWAIAKGHKNFNVHVYRRGLLMIIISLIFSCATCLLMFYFYLHLPERDYYATSGIAPPIKLQALAAPNELPTALLPPDPPTDDVQRVIPQ